MKKLNLTNKNHISHIPPHTANGITLIALVITIIVMLILAAVSITMAVNGGLFGYAGNASQETKIARDEEIEYGNVADDLGYEGLITKYAIRYGDLNLDGEVNLSDNSLLNRHLMDPSAARYLELKGRALENADLNLDGVVDNKDKEIMNDYLKDSSVRHVTELPYTGELFWLE